MTPLERLVERMLDREGGVADVSDGKGVTRFGQTSAWLARFKLPTPQTRAHAAANYVQWLSIVGLTPIVEAGDSLADIVVDVAVMSGEERAVKSLQSALGVTADGVVGPKTMAALAVTDRRRLAREVVALDVAYKGRLITDNPSRARYAAGWFNRLAEHVRQLA